MSAALKALIQDHHLDRQFELVGEHWSAVRRLWLGDTAVARANLGLPEDFLLGVGMPGIADIRPTDDGRFEFTEDGLTALIIPAYDTIPGNLDADPEAHLEHSQSKRKQTARLALALPGNQCHPNLAKTDQDLKRWG